MEAEMTQASAAADQEIRAKALAYLVKNGSAAPLGELRRKFGQALAGLETLLEGIGEEEARRRPAPGRWCVQEIADHLVLSHAPALAQVEAVFAGLDPGEAIPAHLQSADPLGRPYAALLGELAEVHRALYGLFDKAPEEAAETGRIPVAMVLKSPSGERLEWTEKLDFKAYLQAIRVHTLEHQAQVERTLAEIRRAT